jgi:lipoprotein signal peptidase/mannose-6-phosphate isomerase-like protein (cupin superfamily)
MNPIRSRRRLLGLAMLLAALVAADQSSKQLARARLSAPRTLLAGAVTLTLQYNRGVFLGLGADLPPAARVWIFRIGLSAATLAGLLALARGRRIRPWESVALALVLAGSAGNLIDRWLFSGAVTDFAVLSAGPLHTGVFNLADAAIMAGAALLLVDRGIGHGNGDRRPARRPNTGREDGRTGGSAMWIKDLNDCPEFIAGDNTILRELLHPDKAPLELRYSLAHAVLKPGRTSQPHRLRTSEVYYLLSGRGDMSIAGEISPVRAGQAVYIPPHALQFIRNTGSVDLVFLCIVDPAWRIQDEEVLSGPATSPG